LIEFTKYTFARPDEPPEKQYCAGWFHVELANLLDQFLDDVVQRKSPRLMIFAPPASGKTELVSRRFPAYSLGRFPFLKILSTSYAASIAEDVSNQVQTIMDGELYHTLFPASTITGSYAQRGAAVRKADHFQLVGHSGEFRALGIDGAVTGRHGNILLVDDPHKNFQESHSLLCRENVWKAYASVLEPRLLSGGGIAIISTRWHQDDLVSRILQREPERWKVASYPAIAVRDEEHRRAGEALCPERKSLADLLAERKVLGEYLFSTMFQQSPVVEGGNLLKRFHWRFWQRPGQRLPPVVSLNDKGEVVEVYAEDLPEGFDFHIQSWDLTFSGKRTSDFVVGLDVHAVGPHRFITGRIRDQMDFTATLEAMKMFYATHRPHGVYIENAANAQAAISTLENQMPGLNTVTPQGDKYSRAMAASSELAAGNWYLPHPQIASWTDEFLLELSSFPRGRNDDQVDAWTQAAHVIRNTTNYAMYNERTNVFQGLNGYFRTPRRW